MLFYFLKPNLAVMNKFLHGDSSEKLYDDSGNEVAILGMEVDNEISPLDEITDYGQCPKRLPRQHERIHHNYCSTNIHMTFSLRVTAVIISNNGWWCFGRFMLIQSFDDVNKHCFAQNVLDFL